MIKKDVAYVDFNDQKQTDTFWFHITRDRLTDNMTSMKKDVDVVEEMLAGDKRELELEEVQKILALIKKIVWLSYGVRSEDGKRFRQTEADWEDFRYSAAYDELLWGFMQDPPSAMTFMQEVMPQQLIEQAREQVKFADGAQPEVVGQDAPKPIAPPVRQEPDPLKNMTREDLEAALTKMRETGGAPTGG